MSSKTTAKRSSPPRRSVQTKRAQANVQRDAMGGGPNPAEMQQRMGNRGVQAFLAQQASTASHTESVEPIAVESEKTAHASNPETSITIQTQSSNTQSDINSLSQQTVEANVAPPTLLEATDNSTEKEGTSPEDSEMQSESTSVTSSSVESSATEPIVSLQQESMSSASKEAAISGKSSGIPLNTNESAKSHQEEPEVAPALDPRQAIAPAVSAVRNRAAGSSSHSSADVPVSSAQEAALVPQTEQLRMAATQTVETLDAEQENTEEVNRTQFKAALKQAIKNATPEPTTESEAENVMRTGAANASNALRGEMATQRDAAAGPLALAASTEISSSDQVVQPQHDLELEQIGEPPSPVSAASVVPEPLSAERLDYSADRGSTEQMMKQNSVSQEQLTRGKEPTFGSALEARASAEEHEATVETRYRESESNTRSQAQGGGQQALAQGLEGIHGGRALQIGMVVGQQIGTQNKNEAERQRITIEINKIKDSTQIDVTNILNDMEEGATTLFEKGLTLAETAYSETFEEAKGGVGTWLITWGDDWEELIEDALATARVEYLNQVDNAIDLVADFVEVKLTAAKKRVSDGLAEVQKFVAGLDDSVKQFGDDALSAVTADFDAMRSDIDQRRDGLINKLTQQYKDSYERMSAKEEQLRAENKSLWQRVYDATVGAVQKIIEFKNMLLGILARAAAVVESIILDPIGFLSNLISGIKAGLDLFFGNIAEYLKQGLFGWLFGALEGAGIQIPDSFDFKGILSLIMQVLQLTYGAIRKRAVKLLGEEMVERLEQVAEIFKVLITEGPAGLWRMLMEKLSSVKEMLLEEIRGFVISEIIEAGIKWLIGLLNPAAAFVKACMMIYDIIIFFIERGSQIVELVSSIIDSLATIVSGNVQAMAQAVSGALVRILPIAISFLAALLGLGGISGKIRKIIDKIQEPVGEAIDWVIGKAVKLAKTAGNFFGVGGKKENTKLDERTSEEKEHDVKEAVIEGNQLLDRDGITPEEVREELPTLKTKFELESAELKLNPKNEKYYIKVKINPEGESEEEELVEDEKINQYIGETLFKNDNKEFIEEKSEMKGEIEGLGYKFIKQNDAYYIRRNDSSNTQQVHINEIGVLKLGAKSGSSKPEHDNYIPSEKIIEETASGYLVTYKTKTDHGASGPEFKIDINYDKALTSNEDITETRVVIGSNLKLKDSGGARGKTNSAQQGFHNAHLIADRFGGSGRNSDQNIYPSSPDYNTITMKNKEDTIASSLIKTKYVNKDSFNLNVAAKIKGEKANSSSLKAAINEEAKKDNAIQIQQINDAMVQDLVGLVRKDIKGIPGKFISVTYKLNDEKIGSIGEDSDYQMLINAILKKK